MSQPVRVDCQSFEQFLAAVCFLHQLRQEATRRVTDSAHPLDDAYIPGIGVRAALAGSGVHLNTLVILLSLGVSSVI